MEGHSEEVKLLRAEVERLRAENRALKERLERPEVRPVTETSIVSSEPAPGHAHESDVAASVHAGSPPEEKVRLFTQLFRGWEDVCAARWAGKDGRSGYSPSCVHEWDRLYCAKPRIKCAACAHREYLPLSEELITEHLSAFTSEHVLRKTKARFVLGLTATPYRKDGHHPIIMQCGPIRFRTTARTTGADSTIEHVVIPRAKDYRLPTAEKELGVQEVYAALVTDERRNDLIFNDLLLALEKGRSPILLTERTEHLEYFAARLRNFAKNIIVLRGGMGRRQRAEVAQRLAAVPDGEERLLLATGRYIGEGFDDSRLDTMFLALPISWRGTLQQYAGHLHRAHAGKRVVQIYDYVDEQVPVLGRMYRKRLRGYRAMGYTVANAVPLTAAQMDCGVGTSWEPHMDEN